MRKPKEPYKPDRPYKPLQKITIRTAFLLEEGDTISLFVDRIIKETGLTESEIRDLTFSGTLKEPDNCYSGDYIYQMCIIYEKEEDNPDYENQLQRYKVQLAKYKADYSAYKEKLLEYKEALKQYREQRPRKVYEKLKKRFGEA